MDEQGILRVDSHVAVSHFAVSHVAVSHVAVSHFAAIFSGLEPKPQMILHLTPISNEYIGPPLHFIRCCS
jgi:hypothetical protein